MSRETNKHLVARLRRNASFTDAAFGNMYSVPGDPLPKSERQVTAFIQRRTKLYLESWVLPLIDEIEKRLVKPKRVRRQYFTPHKKQQPRQPGSG